MYVCSFAHKTASTNRRSFNGGLRLTRQLCDTLNLDRTRERERLHGRFFGRQHELRMQYLEADKERRLLRCLTPRLILMVSGTFSAPKSVLVARLAYGRLRMAIKYGHSRVHIPALFARIAATLYYERSRRSGRKPFGNDRPRLRRQTEPVQIKDDECLHPSSPQISIWQFNALSAPNRSPGDLSRTTEIIDEHCANT